MSLSSAIELDESRANPLVLLVVRFEGAGVPLTSPQLYSAGHTEGEQQLSRFQVLNLTLTHLPFRRHPLGDALHLADLPRRASSRVRLLAWRFGALSIHCRGGRSLRLPGGSRRRNALGLRRDVEEVSACQLFSLLSLSFSEVEINFLFFFVSADSNPLGFSASTRARWAPTSCASGSRTRPPLLTPSSRPTAERTITSPPSTK